MADQDARALLLTIQANTELLRSNLSAAEKAIGDFASQTQSHLDKSDARFEAVGKGLEKLEGPLERLKGLGETAFAFLVGESLIEKGKEALEFAGNIQFMATQIGVSTDFLQKFRYAASQSGASIEVSNTALTKFSRSVGEAANGDTALVKLFNNLGVNVLDAAGKVRSVESIFLDTASAIQKLPAPAQRTADTMTLMGRGAGALVPLLASGADGFNRLAAAAQQLGVVLNPELIEHAEDVNHKLAALKLILDAQMASAVAQNAAAIGQLAGELVKLAGATAGFLSTNPRTAFAIIGAGIGAKLGGYTGAAVGAVGGALLGAHIDSENRYASLGRDVRSTDLVKAGRAYEDAKRLAGSSTSTNYQSAGPDLQEARTEYIRQLARFRQAKAKGFGKEEKSESLGSTEPGDHNPALKTKPDHSAEKEAQRRKAVLDQAARLDDQALTYQSELTANAAEQLSIARARVETDKAKQLADVEQGVLSGKIKSAEAVGLRDRINDNAILAQQVLDRKAAQTAEALTAKLADQQLATARELLEAQIGLSTTRQARLAQELKLLDLEKQAERARLTRTITDTDKNGNLLASDSEIAVAKQGLSTLDARYGAKAATTQNQNLGPLDAYRQQLKSTIGDTDALNDSLQNVAVDGLKGMEDAFVGVINGTKSVGEAFKDMASSIVSDLLRIAAEKAIFSLLGFNTGGKVGGGADDISIDHFAAGYAVGGVINGPGSGTSDSILARLSNGEFVVNAGATSKHLALLRAINDNSLPGFASGGAIGPIVAPNIGSLSTGASGAAVHLHLDFKGAVVTQDLINDATAKAATAYSESVKHTNRSIAGLSRRSL